MVVDRAPTGGEGEEVRIEVDDEGEGIPSDLRRRVFTKFWTGGARGGSGLGLYIVNGLVRAHGGHRHDRRRARGRSRIGDHHVARRAKPGNAVAPPSFLDLRPMSGPNTDYDPVEVTP